MVHSLGMATPSHILSAPLLLAPQYTGIVADASRIPEQADLETHHLDVMAVYRVTNILGATQERPYAVADGVAFIPVRGSLLNRFNYACSWATGYRALVNMVQIAANDSSVERVVYDVDSYGGEAAGCFEAGEECRKILRAARKPSMAMVDSNCYSAAYAFAASADRISIIPSGGAGSIGVIMIPVEYSKYFENLGIKHTPIFSGDHKADGNIYTALPKAVQEEFKNKVDGLRQRFAEYVSSMRGIPVEDILATEARSFSAQDALTHKLVDKISPVREAYEEFLDYSLDIPETTPLLEVEPMAEATPTTPAVDAAQAERERIGAILSLPGAAANAALANTLALTAGMTAETAAKIMASAAPVATPAAATPVVAVAPTAAASGNALDTAMSQVATHVIKPDEAVAGAKAGGGETPQDALAFILDACKAHGLRIKTS